MLRATDNLVELERALERMERGASQSGVDDALGDFGQRLVQQHRQAFDDGGHHGHGGPRWAETGGWWVKHMFGKSGTDTPLVWTGRAQGSVGMTPPRGGHLEIQAVDYIGKFQFGPLVETETFPVYYSDRNAEGWEKISADAFAEGYKTKTIHRKHREVFYIDGSDYEWFTRRLGQEMGLSVEFGGGGFAEV